MKSLLIFGAFGIGIIAGLRAFTASAVICRATLFGWRDLSEWRLSSLGTPVAVGIASLLAVGELIADKLPMTPSRTILSDLAEDLIAVGGAICLVRQMVSPQSDFPIHFS